MSFNVEEVTENELESLGVTLMEQDSLERRVAETVDKAMISKDDELDNKRLQNTIRKLEKHQARISNLESKLRNPATKISERQSLQKDIAWAEKNDIAPLQQDINEIRARLKERKETAAKAEQNVDQDFSVKQLPSETRAEFLIRTGKITAFGTSNGFEQDAEMTSTQPQDHQRLRGPGFNGMSDGVEVKAELSDVSDDYDDYEYGDEASLISDEDDIEVSDKGLRKRKKEKNIEEEIRNIDDGDESFYQRRLRSWEEKRSELRKRCQPHLESDPSVPEWLKPHPTVQDAVLNSEFKVPGDIYPSLFDYQKTCVQWLWELYSQKTGGIIGDEMGLGKTIQVVSFLAGLHYSQRLDKPVLIVCPATVLRQWCNEIHTWWPPLRTIILHSIGTGMSSKKGEVYDDLYDELSETDDVDAVEMSAASRKSQSKAKTIIDRVFEKGHVLITTYVGLRIYAKHLIPKKWGYVVLDEGHKIRNPDSAISLTCKQLKTPNRIILSGTPIQNNLVELWSLFDFIFPGRLGTLPVFQAQFSIPINIGGYANATNVQVQTGYKCAVVLRDLISPYLLRRVKADVAKDLPQKNEMVLFCKLTKFQLNLYEKFLNSEDMVSVLTGKRHVLYGVDYLRKICNHPDLVLAKKGGADYGDYRKSGKMQVVKALIELWKNEGHKTLLFTQTRQMLDVLEKFIKTLNKSESQTPFKFLRMDGTTPISVRQQLVDTFNGDPEYNVFLLTTRVGGLGVNLTGANRVIIYDPDWNPSTDVQARERAWRLGQKKDVTIYRLMIASSIEEKIYHRQIFKQFLTNKILKDPKQRRFFKMNDLHDLFSLGDPNEKGTETGDMFNGTEINFQGSSTRKSKKLNKLAIKEDDDDLTQVANINGVASLREFQGDKKNDQNNGSGESTESASIMEGIFANSGVHSALAHDSIMESSRPDAILVDREASRVAEEAARQLRESRKAIRRTKIGTPTFTGRFGAAGRVTKNANSNASTSSSSILQNIRAKKDLEQAKKIDKRSVFSKPLNDRGSGSATPREGSPGAVSDENTSLLIEKMRDFIAEQGGTASSSAIVGHLNMKPTTEKDVQVVRSMIRSICDWDGDSKTWSLKEEFKD